MSSKQYCTLYTAFAFPRSTSIQLIHCKPQSLCTVPSTSQLLLLTGLGMGRKRGWAEQFIKL